MPPSNTVNTSVELEVIMVNYCVVGSCNNRENRDTSKRREFLLFHSSPRESVRRAAWDKRINRGETDLKKIKSYRVCSDHFLTSDYRADQFSEYQRTGRTKGMMLNSTWIPNTDPETAGLCLFLPHQGLKRRH